MTGTYVKPDSVLARTAREVVAAHAGGAGPRPGMTTCPVCGEPLPCPTGRAAAEVLFAAGLAESSGLVDAARHGRGPDPAVGPLGLAADGAEPASGLAGAPRSGLPAAPGGPVAGASGYAAAGVSLDADTASGTGGPLVADDPDPRGRFVVPAAAPWTERSDDEPSDAGHAGSGEPSDAGHAASPAADQHHGEPAAADHGVPSAADGQGGEPAGDRHHGDSPAAGHGLSAPADQEHGEPLAAEHGVAPVAGHGVASVAGHGAAPMTAGHHDESAATGHDVSVPADRDGDLPAWSGRAADGPSAPDATAGRPDLRPDPAEIAPVESPEPQIPADVDPLLLGPPLFTQQNRPLDAPQFRPSARPAASAAPAHPPAPASADLPVAAGRTPSGGPGEPAPAPPAPAGTGHGGPTGPSEASPLGSGHPAPPPVEPGRPSMPAPQPGRPAPLGAASGHQSPAAEPGRPAPLGAGEGQLSPAAEPGRPTSLGSRPGPASSLGGEPGRPEPSGAEVNPAPLSGLPKAEPTAAPTGSGTGSGLGRRQPPPPAVADGPSATPGPDRPPATPGGTGLRRHAGPTTGRTIRPPLEAPDMGQLNRPVPAGEAPAQGGGDPPPAVGHQSVTAPLGRPQRPALEPPKPDLPGLARPSGLPQTTQPWSRPGDDATGNPPTGNPLTGNRPVGNPPTGNWPAAAPPPGSRPAATPSAAEIRPDEAGAPSGLPTGAPAQHPARSAADRDGDDTPSGLPPRG